MDNTATAPTPTPNNKITQLTDKLKVLLTNRKLMIIIGTATILLIIIGVVWSQHGSQTNTNNPPVISSQQTTYSDSAVEQAINQGPFSPSQKVASIGEHTVYGKDLNFNLYLFNQSEYASASANNNDLKQRLLDQSQRDYIILKEAQRLGLADLPNDIESVNKDQWAYARAVQQAEPLVKQQFDLLSFETISIFFHNVDLPKIPLEQAEIIARDKMTAFYNQIINNQLTITQAAEAIRNDSSLAQIDPNYQGNAYTSYTDVSPEDLPFAYDEINQGLLNLSTGQVSNIMRIPPQGTPLNSENQEFYTILKMNSRPNQAKGSFSDWLTQQIVMNPIN